MYGHSGAVHELIFFCDRVSRIGSKSLIRNPDFSLPRVGAEVGQGVGEGEGFQACSAAMMLNSAPSFLSQRRDACVARHRSLHYSGDVPWSCLIKNPGF